MSFPIHRIRSQFPSLARTHHGHPLVYFDGPAGTQVPQRVIDAMTLYLLRHNANHGGSFITSRESDAMLVEARRAAADFVGATDDETVVFGANMTTITFQFSRALAKTWRAGDEIVVTDTDHDANVTPWVMAARDAGATVRTIPIRREDCTLDLEVYRSLLNERTRLVAFGVASNATGVVHPVEEITRLAHEAGAWTFVDAVHFSPHGVIDVERWDTDFLVASAYKFFGPHVGLLCGKRAHLESLPAYKVRPAPESLPERWMTGTANHEGIAGVLAAIDYLADLLVSPGSVAADSDRRTRLRSSMQAIAEYEQGLVARSLDGLRSKPDYRVWGITETARLGERVPTVSITSRRESPASLAQRLGEQGVLTWSGNFYALPLTTALGLEPDGMLRIGMVHYNTAEEVDRLLELL